MKYFRSIEPTEGVYLRQLLVLDEGAAEALLAHQARDNVPSWEKITKREYDEEKGEPSDEVESTENA